MQVKKYLYQIREEQREIDELKDRIRTVESSLLPAGIRYDLDKVQTTPSDGTTERLAKMIDYRDQLAEKAGRLAERRAEAQRIIDTLEKSVERQVLDLYFLSEKRMKMWEVADYVGLGTRQVYRIYCAALANLDSRA